MTNEMAHQIREAVAELNYRIDLAANDNVVAIIETVAQGVTAVQHVVIKRIDKMVRL